MKCVNCYIQNQHIYYGNAAYRKLKAAENDTITIPKGTKINSGVAQIAIYTLDDILITQFSGELLEDLTFSQDIKIEIALGGGNLYIKDNFYVGSNRTIIINAGITFESNTTINMTVEGSLTCKGASFGNSIINVLGNGVMNVQYILVYRNNITINPKINISEYFDVQNLANNLNTALYTNPVSYDTIGKILVIGGYVKVNSDSTIFIMENLMTNMTSTTEFNEVSDGKYQSISFTPRYTFNKVI